MRRRLDLELVRRQLAPTQADAAEAILAGRILVEGSPAQNPAALVALSDRITMMEPARPYVSRGGEKLAAALKRFRISASGLRCLDAGASTGGFTDVLLVQGAAHVVAVDVGYGQLDWRLRTDPRVTVMERVNVRGLQPEDLPYAPELVAADLSFISLATVLPAVSSVAADRATFILLIKPQFEAKREEVEPGGIVTDPDVWHRAIESVGGACRTASLGPLDVMTSPVLGPAGNVEFFLHARKGETGKALDVEAAISEASVLTRRRTSTGQHHDGSDHSHDGSARRQASRS